jgi:hypothetical protein
MVKDPQSGKFSGEEKERVDRAWLVKLLKTVNERARLYPAKNEEFHAC